MKGVSMILRSLRRGILLLLYVRFYADGDSRDVGLVELFVMEWFDVGWTKLRRIRLASIGRATSLQLKRTIRHSHQLDRMTIRPVCSN